MFLCIPIHLNYGTEMSLLIIISFIIKYFCRLPLLSEWRGLRDAELSKISGIADCIFVHANGFIGGNHNYNGVLHMAQKTLEMSQ